MVIAKQYNTLVCANDVNNGVSRRNHFGMIAFLCEKCAQFFAMQIQEIIFRMNRLCSLAYGCERTSELAPAHVKSWIICSGHTPSARALSELQRPVSARENLNLARSRGIAFQGWNVRCAEQISLSLAGSVATPCRITKG